MIIDMHAHAFPHQGGAAGYRDVQIQLMRQQNMVHNYWGRMVTNSLDRKYVAYPGEDVGFWVGKYGRWYWTKQGKECWMQRFPTIMAEAEWPPEQMIACMDEIGVNKAILQAGSYMENNYCREYFTDCMRKWPDRFFGTVAIDYDIEKNDEHRESELKKLRDSVHNLGMRGAIFCYPIGQKIDDEKFEPFWGEISRLRIPYIFLISLRPAGVTDPKKQYLESLRQVENVLKRFPDVNGIMGSFGGNVRPPGDPNYTDIPKVLSNYLKLPNAYFEVGYVLAFENWAIWKENYQYPYPLHSKVVQEMYDQVGAEKFLWGADMPFTYRTCTYRQCLDTVRLHFDFMSEEEKALILGKNAAKLFRI
jgi:predicted TIM-barrel fold metal-dependent hydrolase